MNVEDKKLAVTITTQPPNASSVAFLALLVLPVVARADYTTAETLSLEWIPADPEFYEQLVQTARRGDGSRDCNWAIANLINYPGPSTDRLLQDLIESKSASRGLAEDVAWFFRYRYDLSDPLHRELVGHWQLLGHRERIDITLNEDATFIATAYEAEHEANRLWHGNGHWLLYNKTLTLFRTTGMRAPASGILIWASRLLGEAVSFCVVGKGFAHFLIRGNRLLEMGK